MHSIDFHAHHSPLGAYATFTCGRFGKGGGPTIEGAAPPDFDLIVGYADEAGDVRALPFFRGSGATELDEFAAGASGGDSGKRHALSDVRRVYQRGTDTWIAADLSFSIFTPVVPLPDPEQASEAALSAALLPVVSASLRLDNSAGTTPRRLIFAIDAGRPCTILDGIAGAQAVSWNSEIGIAARDAAGLEAWVEWSELGFLEHGRSHLLGRACGFVLDVPPGTVRELELVIGFCRAGTVTSGLEARYFYTRFFPTLKHVLAAGAARFGELRSAACRLDQTLLESSLDDEQCFLFAHAERSYWGNTQLLEQDGKPLWVVLEGEYAMMNTLDLAVDMSFYELVQNPWTVRNLLELFIERYSYVDELARPLADVRRIRHSHHRNPHDLAQFVPPPAQTGLAGGLSFAHDMGVSAHFSPAGHSSYELPGLAGCFSFMTAEQLINWVLTAVNYVTYTNDDAWLASRAGVFEACLASLEQRDDPDPARRNGLVNLDSSRCAGGWEITTYDSLDASLGQARRNLYLASKGFAASLGLQIVFERLGARDRARSARAGAERAARSIENGWNAELGYIPALLEEGSRSAILPAVEGLVFPLFWGRAELLRADGPFASLIECLGKHLRRVLEPGLCLFPDGGWKLSSSSDNSWPSKIFICQVVAERIFGIRPDPTSHAAHARWQQIGSRDWAMSDQILAGVAHGSKYYPRGVTAVLWLTSSIG